MAESTPLSLADRIKFVLITGFGFGLVPVASGTFGTIPAVVLAVLAAQAWTGWTLAAVLWITSAVLLAFGCAQSEFTARVLKGTDPGKFVLDEIVGYFVAVAIVVSVHGTVTPTGFAVTFVAFRAADVLKLPPADRLEELHGAVGIMTDDVAAGVWAGAIALGLGYVGIG